MIMRVELSLASARSVVIEIIAVKALTKPSSQYSGIQMVIADSKMRGAHATINPANRIASHG